jgi:arabinogalactan oligomer / maltooligosaccharide transport system permease protein
VPEVKKGELMKKKQTFLEWFFYRTLQHESPFERMLIHAVLILVCFTTIYPALRVLTISIRPNNQLMSTTLEIIPPGASLESYRAVLTEKGFLRWIWNSAVITGATSIVGVILAATSAYAFSRWRFPGRMAGLVFLLTTQMIPAVMLLVPIYVVAAKLNLINSWVGPVIAYSVTSIPFSIWILKGYYDTIPEELEQAAMIDGTSQLGAFYRMILPLSTPALSIVFLFNFMSAWNDFVLARVMLQNEDMYTWPLGLFRMISQFQAQWGYFAAGALMVTIPVMTLFMASSKFLVSGLTLGSTKG